MEYRYPFDYYALASMRDLQQSSTVDNYYSHFDLLRSLILWQFPRICEAYFLSRFICVLKLEIQVYVLQCHPTNLLDAYELACISEYSTKVSQMAIVAISKRSKPQVHDTVDDVNCDEIVTAVQDDNSTVSLVNNVHWVTTDTVSIPSRALSINASSEDLVTMPTVIEPFHDSSPFISTAITMNDDMGLTDVHETSPSPPILSEVVARILKAFSIHVYLLGNVFASFPLAGTQCASHSWHKRSSHNGFQLLGTAAEKDSSTLHGRIRTCCVSQFIHVSYKSAYTIMCLDFCVLHSIHGKGGTSVVVLGNGTLALCIFTRGFQSVALSHDTWIQVRYSLLDNKSYKSSHRIPFMPTWSVDALARGSYSHYVLAATYVPECLHENRTDDQLSKMVEVLPFEVLTADVRMGNDGSVVCVFESMHVYKIDLPPPATVSASIMQSNRCKTIPLHGYSIHETGGIDTFTMSIIYRFLGSSGWPPPAMVSISSVSWQQYGQVFFSSFFLHCSDGLVFLASPFFWLVASLRKILLLLCYTSDVTCDLLMEVILGQMHWCGLFHKTHLSDKIISAQVASYNVLSSVKSGLILNPGILHINFSALQVGLFCKPLRLKGRVKDNKFCILNLINALYKLHLVFHESNVDSDICGKFSKNYSAFWGSEPTIANSSAVLSSSTLLAISRSLIPADSIICLHKVLTDSSISLVAAKPLRQKRRVQGPQVGSMVSKEEKLILSFTELWLVSKVSVQSSATQSLVVLRNDQARVYLFAPEQTYRPVQLLDQVEGTIFYPWEATLVCLASVLVRHIHIHQGSFIDVLHSYSICQQGVLQFHIGIALLSLLNTLNLAVYVVLELASCKVRPLQSIVPIVALSRICSLILFSFQEFGGLPSWATFASLYCEHYGFRTYLFFSILVLALGRSKFVNETFILNERQAFTVTQNQIEWCTLFTVWFFSAEVFSLFSPKSHSISVSYILGFGILELVCCLHFGVLYCRHSVGSILGILVVRLGILSQSPGSLNSTWVFNSEANDWNTMSEHFLLQVSTVVAFPYFLPTSGSRTQDGHKIGPALSQFLRFCNALISADSGSVIGLNIHGWPLQKDVHIGSVQVAVDSLLVTAQSSLYIQLLLLSGISVASTLHYGMVRSSDSLGKVDFVRLPMQLGTTYMGAHEKQTFLVTSTQFDWHTSASPIELVFLGTHCLMWKMSYPTVHSRPLAWPPPAVV